jgi:hypothetical protein
MNIHNKSTYNRIYNRFSAEFVDAYCKFRLDGLSGKESIDAAKIKLQALATGEMIKDSPNKILIVKVYKNLRRDTKIIEKAIKQYQGMKSQ